MSVLVSLENLAVPKAPEDLNLGGVRSFWKRGGSTNFSASCIIRFEGLFNVTWEAWV